MAPVLEDRHLGIWYQRPVILTLGGLRPIPVPPNEQDWNLDAGVVLGCRLPAFRISQETEEGAIVARTIPHQIHFLHKRRRNAARIATPPRRTAPTRIPEPHH